MTNDKHTPGPWHWRGNIGEDYAMLISDEVGGPIIQTTHDVDPENPTAKLIAAAPLLFAALESLLRAVATRTGTDEAFNDASLALRAAGRLP